MASKRIVCHSVAEGGEAVGGKVGVVRKRASRGRADAGG